MMSGPCISWAILMNSESSNASKQDKAYILHTRAYQNTSLIVEAMTRHHGRLTLVAKGAKRSSSPYQGLLQPFIPLFLSWGGRSEMKTLFKAESVSRPVKLVGDVIYAGFYINELIMYLLHKHEEHVDLFERYHECIANLEHDSDTELMLRYFELDLLEELGYGLSLEQDLQTEEFVHPDKLYHYHMERGIVAIADDETASPTLSGDSLLALARRNIKTDKQKLEAKHLLRRILEFHLEGRPLKTRELFLQKKKFSLSQ